MRLAQADAVVIAGAEEPLVGPQPIAALVAAVREVRPGMPLSLVTMRPRPLESVEGARVFFATTAPPALLPTLVAHLEGTHGCHVVAASAELSDRARLRADLDAARGSYDVLVTELKAASVDVVATEGERLSLPTVFADNVPQTVAGDVLEDVVRAVADSAIESARERTHDGC